MKKSISCAAFFLTLLFCCFCGRVNGQSNEVLVLRKVIEDSTFSKRFTLCEMVPDSIFIINKNRHFADQRITDICGKTVVVDHSHENGKGRNIIELYGFAREKKRYKVFFLKTSNNAALMYEVIKRRKKITVNLIGYGAF